MDMERLTPLFIVEDRMKYFFLWYCALKVDVGPHESISLNFLIPGHTKTAPDCFFGLLKQVFCRQAVSTLDELERVVEDSSVSHRAQRGAGASGQLAETLWAIFQANSGHK